MTTRQEKIFFLTQYELQYLIDHPDQLKNLTHFFAGGGFVNLDDEIVNADYALHNEGSEDERQ